MKHILHCHLCDFEATSFGAHFRKHGAEPGERFGLSDLRVHAAVAHADWVDAENAAEVVLAGGRVDWDLHPDDRIYAAILCMQRGNRYSGPQRLGLNTATVRHLNAMVDADEIPKRSIDAFV